MSADAPQLSRQDLYDVAVNQKVILWCIVAELLVFAARFALPPEAQILLLAGVLGIGVLAAVFVFKLAVKVYNNSTQGIVFGVLTLVPLLGLIILLVINQKATAILNKHGYQVGLMGADLAKIKGG